ncbi:MAG: aminotransferase class V-fold PLP-dependent enzyme [Patescibacteria group bacterium]
MRKISLFKTYISLRSIWNVCLLLIKSNYGTYIGEGPEVKAFEKEFAEKFGFENVAAVNSGSTALELAYELAGICEGDEVIVPVLTHPATGLPAVHRRASVVFADIDPDLNVSVEDVRNKISPKTKALVFVHFGGNNRGLKEILHIAKEKNLILIEDAAQAVGSDFWGKADFTCVSLQAIKVLTSGDGGFLICKDKNLHEKAKRLRWFGYDRELKQKLGDTDIVEAGYKYHMNDITAAIGRGNLRTIDKIISHRKKLCSEYAKHGVQSSIWFAHTLSPKRDDLMKFMQENRIHTGDYHYRNDKYTIFGGKKRLPTVDRLENQYLLLPLHHGVSVKDVRTICSLLRQFNASQT